MPIDDRDPAGDAQALRAVLDEALATRSTMPHENPSDPVDPGWLGVGIWLGLTRPSEARRMLDLIEAGNADQLTGEADLVNRPASDATPNGGQPTAAEEIPVGSMLLSRAATMSEPDTASAAPGSRFGWAARLTREEILSAGRVVDGMLARGEPNDIARGFGLAWDGGVRLPRQERDGFLVQFVELETIVAEVLTGRDLRPTGPPPRTTGLAGLLGSWLARPDPRASEVSAAIEHGGKLARLGLVALWNAWVAARFRALIPGPTFDLLVEPWVTVVGPLPEPEIG